MGTLLLGGEAVEANAAMPAVIAAVEDAFAAYARGTTRMPAKSYVDLPQYNGDFRSMPAYLEVREGGALAGQRDDGGDRAADGADGDRAADDAGDGTGDRGSAAGWDAAGVKWVNVHPDNPGEHDLPTVMGTVIYSDPETGFPLAVMDGTVLTRLRTGAAAAVATKHLAVEDARSLGIVGAGVQSYAQLRAIAAVRPIEEVVVADRNEDATAAFVAEFEGEFDVRGGSIAEAAACDVLSTVTPSREPIVPREALGEHTHVNAVGADAAGKREHETRTLLDAKLVIDDYEQCTHSGEINVPWGEGTVGDADVHAELGQVVTGEREGRTPADGLTLFDSTGLAIQDVAAAHVVYEHAAERGEGTDFELIGAGGR